MDLFSQGLVQKRDEAGRFAEEHIFSVVFSGLEPYLTPDMRFSSVIKEALTLFGEYVLKAQVRRYAPYKEGGVPDAVERTNRYGEVRYDAPKDYEYWEGEGPGGAQNEEGHLADNLTSRVSGSNRLQLLMPWWGLMTVGRPMEVEPTTAKVLRIQLHGGEVIYRPYAGSATGDRWPREDYDPEYQGSGGQERMEWTLRASRALESQGIYGSLAQMITAASVARAYHRYAEANQILMQLQTGSLLRSRLKGF